jgi:hypothetical protein
MAASRAPCLRKTCPQPPSSPPWPQRRGPKEIPPFDLSQVVASPVPFPSGPVLYRSCRVPEPVRFFPVPSRAVLSCPLSFPVPYFLFFNSLIRGFFHLHFDFLLLLHSSDYFLILVLFYLAFLPFSCLLPFQQWHKFCFVV